MTIHEALCLLNILDEDNSSKSAIKSNLRVMLTHMLKAKYQSEYENKNSWKSTIYNSFDELMDEFPAVGKGSLYKTFYIKELDLDEVYRRAVRKASEETHKPITAFPKQCEWTKEQLVNINFIYNFIDEYC